MEIYKQEKIQAMNNQVNLIWAMNWCSNLYEAQCEKQKTDFWGLVFDSTQNEIESPNSEFETQ